MSGPRYFFQGLAIALALVIPTVALSIYAFRQLEISSQSKSEVQATLLTAYQVLSTLKDAEIGQRGLLLNSNPEFLAPYTVALARLPAELAQLARASEASLSRAMMLELTPLIEEKLQELARVLALHQGGQQGLALEGFSSRKGKALMDTIRARIGLLFILDRESCCARPGNHACACNTSELLDTARASEKARVGETLKNILPVSMRADSLKSDTAVGDREIDFVA